METETYLFNDTFDHNLALEIIDNLQYFSPSGFNAFFSTFKSDLKNEKKIVVWIIRSSTLDCQKRIKLAKLFF